MIDKKLRDKIAPLVIERRYAGLTQEDVSKMTGVSRSHISNFERGRINNMYLYDFYLEKFGGKFHGKIYK